MKTAKEWIEEWEATPPIGATDEQMEREVMPKLIRAIQADALEAAVALCRQGENDDVQGGICAWLAEKIGALVPPAR